jgi:hypothetical protein
VVFALTSSDYGYDVSDVMVGAKSAGRPSYLLPHEQRQYPLPQVSLRMLLLMVLMVLMREYYRFNLLNPLNAADIAAWSLLLTITHSCSEGASTAGRMTIPDTY